MNVFDINSFSNTNQVISKHLNWKVDIDFNTKIFKCIAEFQMIPLINDLNEIILDSMDISIISIHINNDECDFKIDIDHKYTKVLGQPLTIIVNHSKTNIVSNQEFTLRIEYNTSPNAVAVNFLYKEQTLSKKEPFLFTQSEPIYTRSLLPCQDTPSNKITCRCEVITPIGIKGFFSGLKISDENEGSDKVKSIFIQNVPIPTYLFAFACGDIHHRQISDRVIIYSEYEVLDKACIEFEDTERFIEIAEKYTGYKYMFTTFDIFILPPSFPYGGMENPNLTFLNPSVLVGDKSAVHVVAHELAHSWTGNLVTNINWNSFFVNEGFTVFLERKIISSYYGSEEETIQSINGMNNLRKTIISIGESHSFSSLNPDLEGVNPDDCFSLVPYEKGYSLLKYIENIIGEERFQDVFQIYIKEFAGVSIDFKSGFMKVFNQYILDNNIVLSEEIEWDYLINSCGQFKKHIEYKSEGLEKMKLLLKEILKYNNDSNDSNDDKETISNTYKSLSVDLEINLLLLLQENIHDLSTKAYELINEIFKNRIKNSICINNDILREWYSLNLLLKRRENLEEIKLFLKSHGRIKYSKHLFELYFRYDKDDAIKYYNSIKYLYHPILVGMINRSFGIL